MRDVFEVEGKFCGGIPSFSTLYNEHYELLSRNIFEMTVVFNSIYSWNQLPNSNHSRYWNAKKWISFSENMAQMKKDKRIRPFGK